MSTAQIRVSVLGPPDLFVTALVAGLTTCGVGAVRVPPHELLDGRSATPAASGVLVVDVDQRHPGPAVVRAVRAGHTVVVIGSEIHRERAAAAIAAGAACWIAKTAPIEELVDAVRAVAAGRMRMDAAERDRWVAEHRTAHDMAQAGLHRIEQLSPREREVLQHLANGLRAIEIAERLSLSITTVRSHIRAVLVKLGVRTQQQATEVYRDTSSRLVRLLGAVSAR